ncbi:MerR family transcriptional regulator [Streptosporangium lutulentum]|uniref:DNA-binding transcriptional MerR regulator n=1 Tax=Streptosporangium lutulentum TaxID=1461250 RepID=A0ABT9QLF8_9ACTN|nr:MerR family transcriptional regulator [Streptosporangium lutulentum]MDP9847598.1 DNA-binding transcriptional MerR regulator [Streptosporangium lutulentum]
MIGKDDGERRWSIGEVARASGMTVRALRHYDEIGLLSASERIASGHRRYTESDVRRLYRVRALRTLGLSLEEIASVLADSADDLAAMREVLTAQLHGLESHAVRIQQLTHRLHGLLGQIDSASMPDPDQFMMTLEMISVFETTFTPEQREQLARRRAELGPEAVEAAKTEWAGLVEELLRHVRDDTPVDDPRVRALAGRWDALGNRFHSEGEDGERTKAAARRTWEENSEQIGQRLPWPVDQMRDLVVYLERVRQAG